ncbi:MAG: AMP-binding protein [Pseudomonadota bacterium]
MAQLPLLRHARLNSVFAYDGRTPITVAQFLDHARQVAQALPDRKHILNVCHDRYRFCVGFAAALLRKQVTLMPPNQTTDMLERLQAEYGDGYRLTDAIEPECLLPTVAFPALLSSSRNAREIPAISDTQTAALMFTSGSTGEPLPHKKSWGGLAASGAAEATRLGLAGTEAALLGTVPPQHMYGLESTILMPMQGGLALHSARPFYPMDICNALAMLPRPRVLVTTPVHLRALVSEANNVAPVDLIVCATAPLAIELATESEARLDAPLYEIYGCTEAGQIATRRTVQSPEWKSLPGIRLRQDDQGTWVSGAHVHDEILLNDVIELKDPGHFQLHGRNSDLVNIAGKRTSLAHLNHQLNSIDGVRDGVFIMPEDSAGAVQRLIALVVAPGLTRETLLEALRERVDPAFMPRPLRLVPTLPRNATGKLPQSVLHALAAQTAATDC